VWIGVRLAYNEIKSQTSTQVQYTLESGNYLTMTPCLLHQKSARGCIQNFFRHGSNSFRKHGQTWRTKVLCRA
jgi:hypothetical protein